MKRTMKKGLPQPRNKSESALPVPVQPVKPSSHWDAHPSSDMPQLHEDAEAAAEEHADEDSGPDDALGLYLRQMGAIPLLSRAEELALAKKLERARQRFRRAALTNWRTLDLVVKTFQKVRAGQLALDPTIDVVTTLNLTREKILERMPHNLPTMTRVLGRADEAFRQALQRTSQVGRGRARRDMWRNLHK